MYIKFLFTQENVVLENSESDFNLLKENAVYVYSSYYLWNVFAVLQ